MLDLQTTEIQKTATERNFAKLTMANVIYSAIL